MSWPRIPGTLRRCRPCRRASPGSNCRHRMSRRRPAHCYRFGHGSCGNTCPCPNSKSTRRRSEFERPRAPAERHQTAGPARPLRHGATSANCDGTQASSAGKDITGDGWIPCRRWRAHRMPSHATCPGGPPSSPRAARNPLEPPASRDRAAAARTAPASRRMPAYRTMCPRSRCPATARSCERPPRSLYFALNFAQPRAFMSCRMGLYQANSGCFARCSPAL